MLESCEIVADVEDETDSNYDTCKDGCYEWQSVDSPIHP